MKLEAGTIRIVMRSSQPEIEVASTRSTSVRSTTKAGSETEQEKASNIHVFVRVRPLSREEISGGVKSAIDVSEDEKTIQVLDRQQSYGYTTMKTFQFDGCFGPSINQEKLMEKCKLQKLLDSVLDGYSSTIMAYGQTGSGKTYTMCGRQEGNTKEKIGESGIIARSVRYIFDGVKQRSAEDKQKSYSLKASYFEIYNEQVNDLLRLDCSPREVKWNPDDGFHVEGLLVVDCETVEDVFAVLNEGAKNRKVGSHNQNKDSSRSHCIMTLYVDSQSSMGNGPAVMRHGRLLFVDLAGSERLKKSKSSGEMLKETGSINRSLFTLGKVISALSEGKKDDIVPYRESMLTKLIMESLGGSSLGLMIACVSPASTAVDQTLSTLHYATCTKQIVNIPSVKMDEKDRVILQLQKEVSRLRDENKILRSKLGLAMEGDLCSETKCGPRLRMLPPGCMSNGMRADDGQPSEEFQPPEEIACGEMLPDQGKIECRLLGHSFFDEQPGNDYWPMADENPESRSTGFDATFDSREGNKNDFTGIFRDYRIGKSKWLHQVNRRQRICVDHLSPGIKTKVPPRTSSRCGLHEPGFQGSIIVNQDAFLRILETTSTEYEENLVIGCSLGVAI